MKLICIGILFLLLHSCKERSTTANTKPTSTNTPIAGFIKKPYQPYPVFTDSIRKKLQELQAKKDIDAIRLLLYNIIANSMPLYWHGTKWDFNGTTRTPGDSSIACGYFITTILKDIGLNINRVKLAQQASSVLIETTSLEIKRFSRFDELKKYLTGLPAQSVLIAGLDFHTGFLLKDKKGNTHFFHSNYIGRAGVTKELIDDSKALINNKTFMTGMLSNNNAFLLQ